MNKTDTTLLALGLLTAKAWLDSLRQSKTLLIMLIIAVVVFGGLFLFLSKIAGAS